MSDLKMTKGVSVMKAKYQYLNVWVAGFNLRDNFDWFLALGENNEKTLLFPSEEVFKSEN